LSFVLDDLLLDEDANDFELLEKKNDEQKDASRDIYKKNQ